VNTRLAQLSQYRSTLEAPSQSHTTSSEGMPPQVQHGDTFVNFFIIIFLISSVACREDTIFCNSSRVSLGIFSSLIVKLGLKGGAEWGVLMYVLLIYF
jgi:hypothetical protein